MSVLCPQRHSAVTYTGEQWRVGGNGSVNNDLVMQLSTDGTNFIALGSSFNFSTPIDSGGAGPLDGNLPANRVAGIGGTYIPAAAITNGQIFYLRWADDDNTSRIMGSRSMTSQSLFLTNPARP